MGVMEPSPTFSDDLDRRGGGRADLLDGWRPAELDEGRVRQIAESDEVVVDDQTSS
jgi:hypothetical protein